VSSLLEGEEALKRRGESLKGVGLLGLEGGGESGAGVTRGWLPPSMRKKRGGKRGRRWVWRGGVRK